MGLAEGGADGVTIGVAVACTPQSGVALEVAVRVALRATAADAIAASGVLARFPHLLASDESIGIWGRRCRLDAPLRDGDRVELYRPLAVDPKEARRRRAKQMQQAKKRK